MTTYFYVPPDCIRGDRVVLPDEEARHAVRVLRLTAGDEIGAVDGEGGWYRIVLDHAGRTGVVGHIEERRADVGEPSYRLTLAAGLVKSRNRFETLIEKAVELGVTDIVPLVTARSEKQRLRRDRALNILVAALKQCGRARLPELHEPSSLHDVLARGTELGLCCQAFGGRTTPLLAVLRAELRAEPAPGAVTVLIGPEGGFTSEEVETASAAGYTIVSLGPRRLRTETAAIAAASIVAGAYEAR